LKDVSPSAGRAACWRGVARGSQLAPCSLRSSGGHSYLDVQEDACCRRNQAVSAGSRRSNRPSRSQQRAVTSSTHSVLSICRRNGLPRVTRRLANTPPRPREMRVGRLDQKAWLHVTESPAAAATCWQARRQVFVPERGSRGRSSQVGTRRRPVLMRDGANTRPRQGASTSEAGRRRARIA